MATFKALSHGKCLHLERKIFWPPLPLFFTLLPKDFKIALLAGQFYPPSGQATVRPDSCCAEFTFLPDMAQQTLLDSTDVEIFQLNESSYNGWNSWKSGLLLCIGMQNTLVSTNQVVVEVPTSCVRPSPLSPYCIGDVLQIGHIVEVMDSGGLWVPAMVMSARFKWFHPFKWSPYLDDESLTSDSPHQSPKQQQLSPSLPISPISTIGDDDSSSVNQKPVLIPYAPSSGPYWYASLLPLYPTVPDILVFDTNLQPSSEARLCLSWRNDRWYKVSVATNSPTSRAFKTRYQAFRDEEQQELLQHSMQQYDINSAISSTTADLNARVKCERHIMSALLSRRPFSNLKTTVSGRISRGFHEGTSIDKLMKE